MSRFRADGAGQQFLAEPIEQIIDRRERRRPTRERSATGGQAGQYGSGGIDTVQSPISGEVVTLAAAGGTADLNFGEALYVLLGYFAYYNSGTTAGKDVEAGTFTVVRHGDATNVPPAAVGREGGMALGSGVPALLELDAVADLDGTDLVLTLTNNHATRTMRVHTFIREVVNP